jgi:DNA-binding MarR family transcriptional regulator
MIEDYLLRLNDLQTEEGKRTISIPQCTIMYELWKKHPAPVLLSDIQSKYNLKRYTVSRNCMMLSYDRIKDNGKTRQGKGWIIKEAKLTPQGEKIVERLFERRKI